MDLETAKRRAVRGHDEQDYNERHNLRRGLEILEKYEKEEDVFWDADQFGSVGDFSQMAPNMSQEDFDLMLKLGWYYDDTTDSWCIES